MFNKIVLLCLLFAGQATSQECVIRAESQRVCEIGILISASYPDVWAEINPVAQQAWAILGWNETLWNADDLDLEELPLSEITPFVNLPRVAQQVAVRLGYNSATWDSNLADSCCQVGCTTYLQSTLATCTSAVIFDGRYDEMTWEELSGSEQFNFGILGWNELSWDNLSGNETEPASGASFYLALNFLEQAAARNIGYTRFSWDLTIEDSCCFPAVEVSDEVTEQLEGGEGSCSRRCGAVGTLRAGRLALIQDASVTDLNNQFANPFRDDALTNLGLPTVNGLGLGRFGLSSSFSAGLAGLGPQFGLGGIGGIGANPLLAAQSLGIDVTSNAVGNPFGFNPLGSSSGFGAGLYNFGFNGLGGSLYGFGLSPFSSPLTPLSLLGDDAPECSCDRQCRVFNDCCADAENLCRISF